jgi:hypothetical protein
MTKRDAKRDAKRDDDDFAWGDALDALFNFRNPDGVLALLADGRLPRPWACKMIARWRVEGWPSLPSSVRKPGDNQVLAAAHAYRKAIAATAGRRQVEKREQRLVRIAREHGTTRDALDDFLNSRGGPYKRHVKAWKRWERVYLADDFASDQS